MSGMHKLRGDGNPPPTIAKVVSEHARGYCEATTLHGFAYWVQAPRIPEKAFWICIVLTFGVFAALIINTAVLDWSDSPAVTRIETFSKHVSGVNYPAITICNPNSLDTGEYTRAILNNLEFDDQIRAFFPYHFDDQLLQEWAGNIFSEASYIPENQALYDTALNGEIDRVISSIGEAVRTGVVDSGIQDSFYYQTVYIMDDGNHTTPFWLTLRQLAFYETLSDDRVRHGWNELQYCMENLDDKKKVFVFLSCMPAVSDNETAAIIMTSLNYLDSFSKFLLDEMFKEETEGLPDEFCSESYWCHLFFAMAFENAYYGDNSEFMDFCMSKDYPHETCTVTTLWKSVQKLAGIRYVVDELDDWPPSNYGDMLMLADLGETSARYSHVPKDSYELLARGLYGRMPQVPQAVEDSLGGSGFPAPSSLALLLTDGDRSILNTIARPAFVEGLRFEELFRMLKFGLWVDYKRESDALITVKDIITKELDVYIAQRMKTKLKFQVPVFLPTILKYPESNHALKDTAVSTITDYGICTAVNSNSIKQTFAENQRINTLAEFLDRRHGEVTPVKIRGSGSIHQSTFWVNVRNPFHPFKRGHVVVALNNWLDFFSVRPQQTMLEGGYAYVVKVIPTVHTATASFRELPLDKRGCRFIDEQPKDQESIYQFYTHKSCVFNCMLKDIPCLPWDYPLPVGWNDDKIPKLCTSYKDGNTYNNSLEKFNARMVDLHALEACEDQCLPNCEETVYDFNVGVRNLDTEELCHEGSDNREMALSTWKSTGNHLTFFMTQFLGDKPAEKFFPGSHYSPRPGHNETDTHMLNMMCKAAFETNIAQLTIEIGKPRVMEIVKDIKVTFPDMLGTIGGTIGLFTGLSLISVIEVAYWIYKTIIAYFTR